MSFGPPAPAPRPVKAAPPPEPVAAPAAEVPPVPAAEAVVATPPKKRRTAPPPPPPKAAEPEPEPPPSPLIRVGSLFSGIGGVELGIHRAVPEASAVFFAERDPYATTILKARWPGVPVFNDVRKVTLENFPGGIDVLCGGFPCQPFSTAGLRKGTDDARFLWPECVRIMKEFKPRVAIFENVAGLLTIAGVAGDRSTAGHVMKRVLDDAAAAGYTVEWDHCPAVAVGAWHRRDRILIVCRRDGEQTYEGGVDYQFGLPLRLWGGVGPCDWPRAGRRVGDSHFFRTPRWPLSGLGHMGGADDESSADGSTDHRAFWPTPMASNTVTLTGGSGTPADIDARLAAPRQFPIPTASNGTGAGGHGESWPNLQTAVRELFPTPTAFEGRDDPPCSAEQAAAGQGPGWRVPLRDAAMASDPRTMFPTPVAYDANPGGPGNHYQGLGHQAAHGDLGRTMFPTPLASDVKGPNMATPSSGSGHGLAAAVEIAARAAEEPCDPSYPAGEEHTDRAGPRRMFPTPTAFEGNSDNRTDPNKPPSDYKRPLLDAVGGGRHGGLYPTPMSQEGGTGPESLQHALDGTAVMTLERAVALQELSLWPTPTAHEGAEQHKGKNPTLTGAVKRAEGVSTVDWAADGQPAEAIVPTRGPIPTPRANSAGGHNGNPDSLQSFTKMYPTPLALDCNPRRASENWEGGDLVSTVTREEEAAGNIQPRRGGMLNPDWVEWLMGFPPLWTLVASGVTPDAESLTWDYEPDLPRLTDVREFRVDRLRCLGNAVVPQVAEAVSGIALRHLRHEVRALGALLRTDEEWAAARAARIAAGLTRVEP